MADTVAEGIVSKNETSVTGGLSFPRIKLRSMVRSCSKPACSEETQKTPKLSNKDRMKLYRQNIKANPRLYEYHKQISNERNRLYRANLNESQKAANREKTRLRVQKYREKMKREKKENQVEMPSKKPKTRHQCQKMRDQWRTSKQRQRANMSAQKRRRINEKRRQKYSEKKMKMKTIGAEKIDSPCEENFKSKSSQRKAVYRAKKGIPTAPEKFAIIIKELTEKATPRKRKALESEGVIYLTPSKRKRLDMNDENIRAITKEMHKSRMKRSREHLQRRRLIAELLPWSKSSGTVKERKQFGVSWEFVTKASKVEGVWEEKRKCGLNEETVEKVEEFFKSSGVSACLPDKKLVSSKTMEPKHIMEQSLQMTYEQFKQKNPDCYVGFSKFAALRPKSVKTMKNNCFNNCLCEYCSNIEMKATVLNNKLRGKGKISPLGFLNKYELAKHTLCSKEEGDRFYKKECINRYCDKCGVGGLKKTIRKALGNKTSVTWNRWENQTYTVQKTGKKTSRKMLRSKSGTVSDFLEELGDELESYSSHLHTARWQHDQFTKLVHELPKNWVLFCMDYAENYTCLYQDEAQGAHWSHDMATLFSIVAYYRCKECEEITNESIVFVSDDMKHDSHAVHHFVSVANHHLTKTRNLTIVRQIHFSDGAASQFKSRTPFADVSKSSEDYGFPVEKHFFGSRHGKGPCDGEFGVIKRTVSQGVVARQAIVRTAEEFYNFAKEKLTKPKDAESKDCSNHKKRTFFYVKETEISRQREDRTLVKPIPETRKQHAVRPSLDGTLGVSTRTLSCFCSYCIGSETETTCQSADHADNWKLHYSKENKRQSKAKCTGKTTPSKVGHEKRGKAKDVKGDMTDTNSELNMNAENESRAEFFHETLTYLQSSTTFKELQRRSETLLKDQRYVNYDVAPDNSVNMVDRFLVADGTALKILKKENLPEEYRSRLPVKVLGDGNCLPRSVSLACFGHENCHEEIRARIVVEMCTNVETYTDNKYLNKGNLAIPMKEASKLAQTFAMFSDEYTPGDRLTSKADIQKIFKAEALKVVENCAFMGIWQLFCAASIVGVKLHSVYPNLGDRLPKLLLNRTILPRTLKTYQSELLILWSSTREDLQENNWIPNHFVPILPQCADSENMIDFEVENFDANLDDISLNDSLIADILDKLPMMCTSPDGSPVPSPIEIDQLSDSVADPQCSGKTSDPSLGKSDPISSSEAHPNSYGKMDPPYCSEEQRSPDLSWSGNTDPCSVGETDPPSSGKPHPLSNGEADSQSTCETNPTSNDKDDPLPSIEVHPQLNGELGPTHNDKAQTSPDQAQGGSTDSRSSCQTDPPSYGKPHHLSSTGVDPESTDENDPSSIGKADPISCNEAGPKSRSSLDPPYNCKAQKSADREQNGSTDPWYSGEKNTPSHRKADTLSSSETDPQSSDEINSTFCDKEDPSSCGDLDPPYNGKAQRRYPIGTNLSIKNGSETLYAVVVQSPDDLDSIHGLWVQFYRKAKGKLWTLEDKPFFVCWEDIVKCAKEPFLSMCGSRIYYKF